MSNGILKKIFIFSILFFSVFLTANIKSVYSQTIEQGNATINVPIQVIYNGEKIWVERVLDRDGSGKENPNSWYFRPIVDTDRIKNLKGDINAQTKYKNVSLQVDNDTEDVGFYNVKSATNNSLNNLSGGEKISEADARKIKTAGGSGGDKGNYTTLGELTKVEGTKDQYKSSNPQYAGYTFTIEQDSAKTGLQVTRVVDANGVEKLKVLSDEEFAAKQKAIEAEIAAANESQIKCNVLSGYFFECSLAKITYVTVFGISKTALKLTGTFFDWTIDYTIVKLKSNLGNESVVTVGWRIFRDIANILFIFFMIYIAITTIISGTGKTAEGIKNIIIVAVLINFSLFFTKIIIDVSNTASISFYNSIVDKIIVDNPLKEKDLNGLIFGDQRTIAEAFISRAGLVTFFNVREGHLNYLMITKQLLLTSLVYLVVAVVLFMASILLITRYIILIVVMLLSSLAFGAYILPSFRTQISEKWWGALIGQSFTAPVFLVMLYISLTILSIIPQTTTTNIGFGDLDNVGHENVLQLVMVIGLLIFSIRMAKSLSDKAGGMAGTITKTLGGGALGLAAWASRNTIGGVANRVASSMSPTTAFGGFVKRRFEGVAKSSFDVRNSRLGGSVIGQSGVDMGKAPKDASYINDAAARAKSAKKRAESISNKPVNPNDPDSLTHREVYERSNLRKFTGGWSRQVQLKELDKLKEKAAKAKAKADGLVLAEKQRKTRDGLDIALAEVNTHQQEMDVIKGALAQSIAENNGQEPQLRTRLATAQALKTAAQQRADGISTSAAPGHAEALEKVNKELAETNLKIENFDKDKEPTPSELMKEMTKIQQGQNKP